MFSPIRTVVAIVSVITLSAYTINAPSAEAMNYAPTSSEYAFEHVMRMKISEKNKKGKEKNDMEMELFFSDKIPHIGFQMEMEGIEAFSVIDADKQQIISLTNTGGMKMGMIFTIKDYDFDAEDSQDDLSKLNIKKTGRKKQVAGYSCEEWLIEEEDGGKTHLWMTKELNQSIFKTFGAMNNIGRGLGRNIPMPDNMPEGFPMEMEQIDKKGNTIVMEVTKVEKNKPKSISTEGYQMMKM